MDKQIYADSYEEGQWFKSLDTRLNDANISQYNDKNPPIAKSLLQYDNPDIILTVDDIPRLVVERTKQVPTGQNLGQRYARLIRSIELGVPCIYMFPFVKLKGGKNPGACWSNPWYFKAINRINSIHNSTLVPVRWPNDDDYKLETGDIVDYRISRILTEFINKDYRDLDFCLKKTEFRSMTFNEMNNMFEKSIDNNIYWPNTPPSVKTVDTRNYVDNIQYDLSDKFKSRPETVVYSCKTSNIRTDPYTGMQFVYDYSLCRNGPHKTQKVKNFVINLPKQNEDDWMDKYPLDTSTKGGLWYETANAIKFNDGIIEL